MSSEWIKVRVGDIVYVWCDNWGRNRTIFALVKVVDIIKYKNGRIKKIRGKSIYRNVEFSPRRCIYIKMNPPRQPTGMVGRGVFKLHNIPPHLPKGMMPIGRFSHIPVLGER